MPEKWTKRKAGLKQYLRMKVTLKRRNKRPGRKSIRRANSSYLTEEGKRKTQLKQKQDV